MYRAGSCARPDDRVSRRSSLRCLPDACQLVRAFSSLEGALEVGPGLTYMYEHGPVDTGATLMRFKTWPVAALGLGSLLA